MRYFLFGEITRLGANFTRHPLSNSTVKGNEVDIKSIVTCFLILTQRNSSLPRLQVTPKRMKRRNLIFSHRLQLFYK